MRPLRAPHGYTQAQADADCGELAALLVDGGASQNSLLMQVRVLQHLLVMLGNGIAAHACVALSTMSVLLQPDPQLRLGMTST